VTRRGVGVKRLAAIAPSWLTLALCGVSCLALGGFTGPVGTARAEAVAEPVVIDGSGDTDIVAELVAWQNALYESDQPVDFQYFQRGSKEGREQLLSGLSKFTVSGAPFTAAELSARPAGAGEIIDVPLSVGSTSIIIASPAFYGWATETESPCDLDDPDVDPESPECKTTRGELTGDIRIPPNNLAAMMVGLPTDFGGLSAWVHPDIQASLGTSDLVIQDNPIARPTFLNRTEGTTGTLSMLSYAKVMAPEAWSFAKVADPGFRWEPVGEVMSPRTPSRYGLDTQIGLMSLSNTDPVSNASPQYWSGNMGPVPTTLIPKVLRDNPDDGYRVVALQNANGDWVTADRASLDAALAAGTGMNVAATNEVPGAYPLVHINRLYTVAGTLSPDEANALAAAVRYIATDGQQLVIDDGGTDLPDRLRAEALAQADQIVEKNCSRNGYEVTTGGPSRFEPDTPGVRAITSMKHCTLVPVVAPTTTTTTTTAATTTTTAGSTTSSAATTSTTAAASGGPVLTVAETESPTPYVAPYVPPYVPPVIVDDDATVDVDSSVVPTDAVESTDVADSSTSEVEQASAGPPPADEVASGGGGGTRPRGVALTQLPMVRPEDGSEGFDKLGTLLLGAATFLLGRRIVAARRASA